jgi:hypothetical protein
MAHCRAVGLVLEDGEEVAKFLLSLDGIGLGEGKYLSPPFAFTLQAVDGKEHGERLVGTIRLIRRTWRVQRQSHKKLPSGRGSVNQIAQSVDIAQIDRRCRFDAE